MLKAQYDINTTAYFKFDSEYPKELLFSDGIDFTNLLAEDVDTLLNYLQVVRMFMLDSKK